MNKKIYQLSAISLIFFSVLMNMPSEKSVRLDDIYGFWKSDDLEKDFLIKFSNDGECLLIFGDNDTNLIVTLNGKFSIDLTKRPIPLSIRDITQLNHPIYTIVDFVGPNNIKLGSFAQDRRFMNISFDHTESISLKRVNQIE